MKKKSLLFKSISKLLILSALIFQSAVASAQTTLVAGDIAFTGFNSYTTGGVNPNDFSFVILRTGGIAAGTVIKFTDNGWNTKVAPATFGTNEGVITWTATAALPQFTEVKIDIVDGGGTPAVNQVSHGSATVTGGFVLSYGGDQILAYQMPATTPVFISAVSWYILNTAPNQTTLANWDNFANLVFTTNKSAIPPGLTNGVNALLLTEGTEGAFNGMENGKYNCTGSTGSTLSDIRTAINNRNNWLKGDAASSVAAYTLPSGCTFAVGTPAAIATQPVAATGCAGETKSFQVVATDATSYQWQVDKGAGFTDISNVAPYSGSTTSKLTITGITADQDGYTYRVNVGGAGGAVTSSGVLLTVNSLPAITGHPQPANVCEKGSTEFVVSATGTQLTYQWQYDAGKGFVNFVDSADVITGSKTKNIILKNVSLKWNNVKVKVLISGKCSPAVASQGVLLTVNALPVIVKEPVSLAGCTGSTVKFGITSTGTNNSFKWYLNSGTGFQPLSEGAINSGVTNDTLTIQGVLSDMVGNLYKVEVINSCSTVVSGSVKLDVNQPVALVEMPVRLTICEGKPAKFEVIAKGTGLKYLWQEGTGATFVDLPNSGIYSGTSSSVLNIVNTPFALNGKTYKVVVSGSCPGSITTQPVILTVMQNAAVLKDPVTFATCPGGKATFAVEAAGTGISYQWQTEEAGNYYDLVNSFPISGANSPKLTIAEATADMNKHKVRVIVTGDCSADTSVAATILASDTVFPVITNVPKNIVVYTTTECNAVAQWNQANATDNCELVSFAANYASGSKFPLGKTLVTYQATDASGNKKLAEFSVTVLDTIKPVYSGCHADITIIPGIFNYILPVATDNCSGNLKPVLISGLGSGAIFPSGTHQEVYEVKDASGNSRKCSFVITASPVTGINASEEVASWSVYPNPASGSINISDLKSVNGKAVIQLINAEGMVLKTIEAEGSEKVVIPAEELEKGLYLISVNADGKYSTRKIVVE